MRETELSPIVSDYLRQNGYRVFAEVFWRYGRTIDLVATRNDLRFPVVIELKLSLTKELLRQVYTLQLLTPYVWGVVATNPMSRSAEEFIRRGIGIATTKGGRVQIISKPNFAKHKISNRIGVAKLMLEYGEENGIAGLQLNAAPAQNVYNRVMDYFAKRPSASWQEIFSQIPNHYANYKSMRGAIKILAQYKNWPIP